MLSIKECIDHTSLMDYVHTCDKLLDLHTVFIRNLYSICTAIQLYSSNK